MRHKRKKYLPLKENNRGYNHIVVKIYYDLGGMNYFTGINERRGIYVTAYPSFVDKFTETYTAFTGSKMLLKELKRFSQKSLYEIDFNGENVVRVIDSVLLKNNLKLEEV